MHAPACAASVAAARQRRACDAATPPVRALRTRARAARTPHDVLGVPPDADAAAIKAAFRARLKLVHPDVNPSADAASETQLLVRAFEALTQSDARRLFVVDASSSGDGGDPFAEPEGPATALFVNELRCLGRRCASSCVAAAPAVFTFAEDTGAARAVAQAGPGDEYALRVAVGQCPPECIHYVTPRQHAILVAELGRARSGAATPDEVGAVLYELLARARYENGRERAPRRTPRASTQYVDWF